MRRTLHLCVAKELGMEFKLALQSDSKAMKHVELRFLFVKDLLKREKLTLSKFLEL